MADDTLRRDVWLPDKVTEALAAYDAAWDAFDRAWEAYLDTDSPATHSIEADAYQTLILRRGQLAITNRLAGGPLTYRPNTGRAGTFI